jgi:hypothetical protein
MWRRSRTCWHHHRRAGKVMSVGADDESLCAASAHKVKDRRGCCGGWAALPFHLGVLSKIKDHPFHKFIWEWF